MYIARLKDENGKRHEIQEEVIMELWSRLAERGYWKQPDNPICDMETEKELTESIRRQSKRSTKSDRKKEKLR